MITDFSELEQIGRSHVLTIHGGCMPTAEYQQIDGKAEALKLMQDGNGSVIPYGVVYNNGMGWNRSMMGSTSRRICISRVS